MILVEALVRCDCVCGDCGPNMHGHEQVWGSIPIDRDGRLLLDGAYIAGPEGKMWVMKDDGRTICPRCAAHGEG